MTAHPRQPSGWRWAIALAFVLLALRVLILTTSGLGLSADEAHYWDWSRHLDWSYPTKGPGIAYAIAGATALLGDEAWAIRTVAALSGSVGVLLAFGLTRSAATGLEHHDRLRAAKWGAALIALFPAYQVTGLIATIDGPYVACWLGASWAALALLRRLESERSAMGPALLLGVLLGIGFLFKYTILLLVPALVITLFVRRSRVYCWKRSSISLLGAGAMLALCALPVVIWNQREGWPTVAHLLGHLGAPGGDVPTDGASRPWTPLWFIGFVGTQIGIAGPALVLMWLARKTATPGPERAWLVIASLPIFAMYLVVSLFTDAEANWPIAGYSTLLCLAAVGMPAHMARHRALVRAWREKTDPRPKAGFLRKAPETVWQLATHWTVGWGVVPAILMLTLPLLMRTPVRQAPALQRLQQSERLGDLVLNALDRASIEPSSVVIITARYTSASRLAHELHMRLGDGAPLVTSAASLVGDRRSSYDYWPETDPCAIRAQTVLFVGGAKPEKWTRRFDADTMTPMLDAIDPEFGGLFLARNYAGVQEGAGCP